MPGVKEVAVNFTAAMMEKNPNVTMDEVKAAAAKHGINVYPLIMGLARKKLGVPSTGRAPQKSRRRPRVAPRFDSPTRTSAEAASTLNAIIGRMRDLERENEILRVKIARIIDLLRAAP
jgi:hypothetical protein